MRTIVFSVISSVLIATPIMGADPAYDYLPIAKPAPAVIEHFDWSGFYAGINGGYGTGNVATAGSVSGPTTNVPLRGALVGVTAGANWQNGDLVFGAEGDISWSGMSGSAPCVVAVGFSCNAEIDWVGTARARAGIAFDNVLLFGTGGVAIARGNGTITPAFPGLTNRFEDTFVGWTLGAGVELAVSKTVSVKAQYDYLDLGMRLAPVGALHTIQTTEVAPNAHNLKLGVNFHF